MDVLKAFKNLISN